MVLSETNTRVLLVLATKMATITQTPDGLLVVPHPEVRRWDLVMLVGLLSPLDGIFNLWSSVISIPKRNLPEGFILNAPPDETFALAHVEAKTQETAEPVAVKLSQKDVYLNQLRENFRLRMQPAEVSQILKFLIREGMTADEIIAATGISSATLYRCIRVSVENPEVAPQVP